MRSTTKVVIGFIVLAVIGFGVLLAGNTITHPTIENSKVIEVAISELTGSDSTKDITIFAANGDSYYINRGLEQGIELQELRQKIVGYVVKMHLAKTFMKTTNHISQLEVNDEVIYTEFK